MEEKLSDIFYEFTHEPNKEKRHALINNLTEEQAKQILISIADFKYRSDVF